MAKKRITTLQMAGSLLDAATVKIDGAILGRVSFSFSGSVPDPYFAVRIGFAIMSVSAQPEDQWTDPAIFERHVITAADVGKTLYEDGSSDPNFGHVVARLRNGIDDRVFFRWRFPPDAPFRGAGGIGGGLESSAFKDSDLTKGIDFAGQQIARIGMRLDHLRFFGASEEVDGERIESHWHVGHVTFLIEREGYIEPKVSL